MDLFAELQALTKALDAGSIDYALCGGIALAIHGAPRATQDIDILLRPDDLPRLEPVRRALAFTLESLPMDFANGIQIQRFTKIVDGQPLMLDVLMVTTSIESTWASRQVVEFDGGRLRVVSREGLIGLKLAAGRPQDIADIQRLQEVSRG